MRGFDFLSEFDERVLRTIRKFNMICSGDCIVVAVSGGPDSMSLLRVLIKLREKFNIKLVVAHVNHMIRAVADSETEFVKGFCEDNGVECFVKKVDVVGLSEKLKISCEEAGRNVRYDFFDEIFDKVGANKIAIAHNKNDNAETVLMNIMRGSGVSGLKGIEPVRDGKFIRPLIEIDRKSIEQYCVDENLNPKFDESNKENVYTRNKVRNLLIPYIEKEFNPNIIESISRLSDLATQESNFVDNVVDKEFKNTLISYNESEIELDLKKFNNLDSFIKAKIILKSVAKLFNTTKGIEKVHIEDVIKLCERNIGNKYLTPNKNLKIFIKKGVITISKV